MITEIIYLGNDNAIDLQLKADGVAQDLSSVTKIVAKIEDVEITNIVGDAWPIKWLGLGLTGKIQLQLGSQALTVSSSSQELWLILYDAVNTDGIVWGSIKVRVRQI